MIWKITYTIADEKAAKSRLSIGYPAAASHAQVVTYAQDFAERIEFGLSGAVVDISLSKTIALPGGLKTEAMVNSDVEEVMKITYGTLHNRTVNVSLPTFNQARAAQYAANAPRKLDLVFDTDSQALDNVFLDANAFGYPYNLTDKRGDEVDRHKSSVFQHRKSRR